MWVACEAVVRINVLDVPPSGSSRPFRLGRARSAKLKPASHRIGGFYFLNYGGLDTVCVFAIMPLSRKG